MTAGRLKRRVGDVSSRPKRLTPNQIVAFNLTRARTDRGWSQPEAAAALEPFLGVRWSRASYSAVEPSVDGSFEVHVLRAMRLLGIGAGIAFNPVLLAAMGDVEPHESGLASGVVNTAFMMGGALGLAVLVAVSDSRRATLLADGTDQVAALNGGLNIAFAVGAVAALSAAAIGGLFLRPKAMDMTEGLVAAH